MTNDTPLEYSKERLRDIIGKIEADSSVGIDAQLTHAIIIAYLQRIEQRLDRIEQRLSLQQ